MSIGQTVLIVLAYLLRIYIWAIIASAVLSWGFLPPSSQIVRTLRFITEPVVNPCRKILSRILPYNWRRYDFSPVLAIIIINIIIFMLERVAFLLL